MTQNQWVERLPPHDGTIEAALIGAALLRADLAPALAWLNYEDFYTDNARLAWQAIQAVMSDGQATDLLSVSDWLALNHPATFWPMADWLTASVTAFPESGDPVHYAQIIARHAQARQVIRMAGELASLAYQGKVDAAIGLAMHAISRMETQAPMERIKPYRQVLAEARDDAERRQAGNAPVIRTGFADIDRWLGGFEPGQLILLAGRPGSGKSALGLALARRIAGRFQHVGQGESVDIVTMEMSAVSQARRLISLRTEGAFTTGDMRRGFRNDYQDVDVLGWSRFLRAVEQESQDAGESLYIREDVVSTEQLNVHVLRAKQTRGMKVLVIDQLNLMSDEHRDETQRIGRISTALKRLAMRHQIVVICLTQLNREVEKRQDHRPQLADLRQSGELEQNADIVLGLYRPAYYHPPEEGDPPAYAEYAELLGLKARDEEANVALVLRFIPSAAAFTDWDFSGDLESIIAAKEGNEGRKSA